MKQRERYGEGGANTALLRLGSRTTTPLYSAPQSRGHYHLGVYTFRTLVKYIIAAIVAIFRVMIENVG